MIIRNPKIVRVLVKAPIVGFGGLQVHALGDWGQEELT